MKSTAFKQEVAGSNRRPSSHVRSRTHLFLDLFGDDVEVPLHDGRVEPFTEEGREVEGVTDTSSRIFAAGGGRTDDADDDAVVGRASDDDIDADGGRDELDDSSRLRGKDDDDADDETDDNRFL